MPDGALKLKAFEVILTQLVSSGPAKAMAPNPRADTKQKQVEAVTQPKSLSARILALQGDGFFDQPQTISAVRTGLQSRGWHYPLTTLSGTLQGLVQRRKLRRQQVKDGNKTLWKYSNP
jgi:hypothetical protein